MKSLSLFELQHFIKKVMVLNFNEEIQLIAELAKVNTSRGHTYIELVEKSKETNMIIARAHAVLWKGTHSKLKTQYGDILNEILTEGMEIQMKLKVEYHELYGLKFHITHIDPAYTIGAFASRRAKILEAVKNKGYLDANKKISIPSVIQNIAVISSESAAGLADFVSTIKSNPYQLKIKLKLFQAAMQGDKVEEEVCHQLKIINDQKDDFDLIVIIRGGGSKIDLSYFDNLAIAKSIANSALPVYAGIGHEIDESITELVAHTAFKTPTAVSEAILNHNLYFVTSLHESKLKIERAATYQIERKLSRLEKIQIQLGLLIQNRLEKARFILQEDKIRVKNITASTFQKETHELERLADKFNYINPYNILSKGFVLAEQEGKPVHSIDEWDVKKEISFKFLNGKMTISNYESKRD